MEFFFVLAACGALLLLAKLWLDRSVKRSREEDQSQADSKARMPEESRAAVESALQDGKLLRALNEPLNIDDSAHAVWAALPVDLRQFLESTGGVEWASGGRIGVNISTKVSDAKTRKLLAKQPWASSAIVIGKDEAEYLFAVSNSSEVFSINSLLDRVDRWDSIYEYIVASADL